MTGGHFKGSEVRLRPARHDAQPTPPAVRPWGPDLLEAVKTDSPSSDPQRL